MRTEEHYHADGIRSLGPVTSRIIEIARTHPIIAFYGDMGAGKTTLIQRICHQMGVNLEVTSPTFALVNEYPLPTGEPLYHFDFYRINNPVEALDFGIDEYLDSGHLCLMEWPERIAPLLPADIAEVHIHVEASGIRAIRVLIP